MVIVQCAESIYQPVYSPALRLPMGIPILRTTTAPNTIVPAAASICMEDRGVLATARSQEIQRGTTAVGAMRARSITAHSRVIRLIMAAGVFMAR